MKFTFAIGAAAALRVRNTKCDNMVNGVCQDTFAKCDNMVNGVCQDTFAKCENMVNGVCQDTLAQKCTSGVYEDGVCVSFVKCNGDNMVNGVCQDTFAKCD